MMVGDVAGRPFAGEAPAWIRATQRQGQIEVLGRSAPAVRLVPMIGVLKVNKREYPGALEIVPSGENLVVINELPLEDYLAGAVKAEAGDKMPMEMLKAQAIVARTYAAYHRQLNESKPYHIVASTAHQQYLGHVPADSPAWAAVRETEGRVMLLGGALFPAFYHTDSGGHTEDPRVVFGTANMPRAQAGARGFRLAVAPSRVEARRSPLRAGRALAEARHLGGARRGPRSARAVDARSGSPISPSGASTARRRSGAMTSGGSSGTTRSRARCSAWSSTARSRALPGADTATAWDSISGAPRPWPTSATTRPRSSSTTTRAPPSPPCARQDAQRGPSAALAPSAAVLNVARDYALDVLPSGAASHLDLSEHPPLHQPC